MQQANDLAAHVQRTWLMTAGLAAEIGHLRFQPEERIVPAPDLDALAEAADQAAARAHEVAERIGVLLRDGSDGVDAAGAELTAAAGEADRSARRVAQLGMGVSAHTLGGERIERLDRACVALLRPDGRAPTPTGADDVTLAGRTRVEVEVELAGMVCRLLVDRRPALWAVVPGAWGRLAVDDTDTLHLTWSAQLRSVQHTEWPSPIMVSDPVRSLLDVLLHDPGSAARLAVRVQPSRVVLRDEHDGDDRRRLWAYMDAVGALHIDGQDLGPKTAPVSDDGEYEWYETINVEHLGRLVELLGGQPEDDVLAVLADRYTGGGSYELEALLRASEIPMERFVY